MSLGAGETTLLRLTSAYAMIEQQVASHCWAIGDDFTLADCAAGPPLFYINKMTPLSDRYPHADAYLHRLMQRPSYARALEEARPYIALFPMADKFRATYSRALGW